MGAIASENHTPMLNHADKTRCSTVPVGAQLPHPAHQWNHSNPEQGVAGSMERTQAGKPSPYVRIALLIVFFVSIAFSHSWGKIVGESTLETLILF